MNSSEWRRLPKDEKRRIWLLLSVEERCDLLRGFSQAERGALMKMLPQENQRWLWEVTPVRERSELWKALSKDERLTLWTSLEPDERPFWWSDLGGDRSQRSLSNEQRDLWASLTAEQRHELFAANMDQRMCALLWYATLEPEFKQLWALFPDDEQRRLWYALASEGSMRNALSKEQRKLWDYLTDAQKLALHAALPPQARSDLEKRLLTAERRRLGWG
ncbi:hypothetical protein [Ktedonospora formicarum]|uniref:Uncharacterized protein n=1 Tax=Ktedonospora formicarum TaxID=2778364 RepID=A0A8J3IAW6_9CHLR|nr:hypothetical protein [Ktedonospora formicarum]GHO49267.1 hypothetical protein KSX_74300 [Ktedonospora formicarum]